MSRRIPWTPGDVCDNGNAPPDRRKSTWDAEIHAARPRGEFKPDGPMCVVCGEVIFCDRCRCGYSFERFVTMQQELLYTSSQVLDAAGTDYLISPTPEALEALENALKEWISTRRIRESLSGKRSADGREDQSPSSGDLQAPGRSAPTGGIQEAREDSGGYDWGAALEAEGSGRPGGDQAAEEE